MQREQSKFNMPMSRNTRPKDMVLYSHYKMFSLRGNKQDFDVKEKPFLVRKSWESKAYLEWGQQVALIKKNQGIKENVRYTMR